MNGLVLLSLPSDNSKKSGRLWMDGGMWDVYAVKWQTCEQIVNNKLIHYELNIYDE